MTLPYVNVAFYTIMAISRQKEAQTLDTLKEMFFIVHSTID